MLKKSGFDGVEMAESGEEALERLKSLTPDAIFVDFLMDGIDGLETITEIKKDPRFDTTPIVMCTANEGDEYVRAAVDHGALGILAKPPTEESLGQIIDLIEQHQEEVSSQLTSETETVEAPSEVGMEVAEVSASGMTQAAPVVAGLCDEDVRHIAQEVASQAAERAAQQTARQIASQVVSETLDKRLETAVNDYLDQQLEPMVSRLVRQGVEAVKPPEIDDDKLRTDVIGQVNKDLEDFVRQLNQRSVEELIQANTYAQMSELRDEFSSRLKDQEQRIISQVPEKNDMIEHIRVVTEGSLEAQVHETATQVAQEIANSVATETVEQMLDQHLAQQSMEHEAQKGGKAIWILLGFLLIAFAGTAYFLL
jgi:CheY-like chemotaxis protein